MKIRDKSVIQTQYTTELIFEDGKGHDVIVVTLSHAFTSLSIIRIRTMLLFTAE